MTMNTYSPEFLIDLANQVVAKGRDPYNRIGFNDIDLSEALCAFDDMIENRNKETNQ